MAEEGPVLNWCNFCGVLYTNIRRHNNQVHETFSKCWLCEEIFADRGGVDYHVPAVHGQQMGHHPPSDVDYNRLNEIGVPLDHNFIESKLNLFGIGLPGTDKIVTDNGIYFVDPVKEWTAMTAEVMNAKTIRKIYTAPQGRLPFKANPLLPGRIPLQGIPNDVGVDATHLMARANKLLTEIAYKSTYDVLNLTATYSGANSSHVASSEHHFRVTSENWPWVLLLTLPIYGDNPRRVVVNGMRFPLCERLIKIGFYGDLQYQVFDLPNEVPDIHLDLTYYRSSLDVVRTYSDLEATLPDAMQLSWESAKLFKCRNNCRSSFNLQFERDVHEYWCKHGTCPFKNCKTDIPATATDEYVCEHVLSHPAKVCSVCNKRFISPKSLSSHKSIHIIKSFPCNQCEKICRSQKLLTAHKMMHLQGPFNCRMCGKSYPKLNSRNSHEVRKHKKIGVDTTREPVLHIQQKLN